MTKKRYTPEQLDFLKTGYQTMNVRDLARAFNKKFGTDKSETAIKATLGNHKIRCGRKHKDRLVQRRLRIYTEEQARFLKNNYKGRSVADLQDLFNTHFNENKTWQQIRTFVHNRDIVSGRTGHFPKGNKPWNTGTRGVCKPNSGSFKKGQVPLNRKPLGDERICSKDGFILIKVKEHNPWTGGPTRYKHKHRHIWEQNNGPVPEGMVVAFRDGDKTNCSLDNLMLISRSLLVRLNQIGYSDAPAELKPSILALAKLRSKAGEKLRESQ